MHVFVFIFCIVLINLIVIGIGTSGHLFLYAAAPTKPGGGKPTPTKTNPGGGKPTAGKPTPTKSTAGKPTPTKSAAGKPTPTKPAAGKPTPTKPKAGKPIPTKPTAGKPGDGIQSKGLVVTSGPEKIGSQTTILAGNKPVSALVVGNGLYMSSKDGKSQFYQDTGSGPVPISPSQAVSLLQSQASSTSDARRSPLLVGFSLANTVAAVAAYAMGSASSSAEKKQVDAFVKQVATLAGRQLGPTSGTKPLPSQTTVITDAAGKSYLYDPKTKTVTSCSARELRSDDIFYRYIGSDCPSGAPRANIYDLQQNAQNQLHQLAPGLVVPTPTNLPGPTTTIGAPAPQPSIPVGQQGHIGPPTPVGPGPAPTAGPYNAQHESTHGYIPPGFDPHDIDGVFVSQETNMHIALTAPTYQNYVQNANAQNLIPMTQQQWTIYNQNEQPNQGPSRPPGPSVQSGGGS